MPLNNPGEGHEYLREAKVQEETIIIREEGRHATN